MTARLLDKSRQEIISDAVLDSLQDEGGFTPEEIIPGLVLAIVRIAQSTGTSLQGTQLLDEASDMLADGGL